MCVLLYFYSCFSLSPFLLLMLLFLWMHLVDRTKKGVGRIFFFFYSCVFMFVFPGVVLSSWGHTCVRYTRTRWAGEEGGRFPQGPTAWTVCMSLTVRSRSVHSAATRHCSPTQTSTLSPREPASGPYCTGDPSELHYGSIKTLLVLYQQGPQKHEQSPGQVQEEASASASWQIQLRVYEWDWVMIAQMASFSDGWWRASCVNKETF